MFFNQSEERMKLIESYAFIMNDINNPCKVVYLIDVNLSFA